MGTKISLSFDFKDKVIKYKINLLKIAKKAVEIAIEINEEVANSFIDIEFQKFR